MKYIQLFCKNQFISIIFILLLPFILTFCTKDSPPEKPVVTLPTKANYEYLEFNMSSATHLTITKTGDYAYAVTTTEPDPYVSTNPIKKVNGTDSVVFAFEYKCVTGVKDVQIFFSPVAESRSVRNLDIVPSAVWTNGSFNFRKPIADFEWGKAGDFIRMDFSPDAGVTIELRNIHFRGLNDDERKKEEDEKDAARKEQQAADDIKSYLSATYPAKISEVTSGQTKITVRGNYSGEGNFSLCEITPWQNVTQTDVFEYKTTLTASPFSLAFDRFVVREGATYDRTLSKWVLVKTNGGKDEIVSHARYADDIYASQTLDPGVLAGKKGLGGFFNHTLQRQDLDDLQIKSVTVNVPFTAYLFSSGGNNRLEHAYGGKTWYFDRTQIENMDNTLKECAKRNIVVAAIILVQKASECPDQEIGKQLQHPDFSSGYYTMPNMSTPKSIEIYSAALDFLASRYMRSDNLYGRIHHWIMHNEVDAGLDWTNMGTNRAMMNYMDTYIKSMRLCYNIARQYDRNTEVFGSFTHSWTAAVGPDGNYYATVDMLNTLNAYCKAEGDFKWGLAIHPYPQDLNEPKTWLDRDASFSMGTKLVTFKNVEVLDKWAKSNENKYQGTVKRSVWLSENGTNSRSYNETDLKEQAAGFAYAWKKIKALDGIDGIQWHNWFDNPAEFGLKIGLRTDQLAAKPVWFLYQAAGTSNEDAVFEPYKAVIGIPNWNIIQPIY